MRVPWALSLCWRQGNFGQVCHSGFPMDGCRWKKRGGSLYCFGKPRTRRPSNRPVPEEIQGASPAQPPGLIRPAWSLSAGVHGMAVRRPDWGSIISAVRVRCVSVLDSAVTMPVTFAARCRVSGTRIDGAGSMAEHQKCADSTRSGPQHVPEMAACVRPWERSVALCREETLQ